jgi:hypothetical protein
MVVSEERGDCMEFAREYYIATLSDPLRERCAALF